MTDVKRKNHPGRGGFCLRSGAREGAAVGAEHLAGHDLAAVQKSAIKMIGRLLVETCRFLVRQKGLEPPTY